MLLLFRAHDFAFEAVGPSAFRVRAPACVQASSFKSPSAVTPLICSVIRTFPLFLCLFCNYCFFTGLVVSHSTPGLSRFFWLAMYPSIVKCGCPTRSYTHCRLFTLVPSTPGYVLTRDSRTVPSATNAELISIGWPSTTQEMRQVARCHLSSHLHPLQAGRTSCSGNLCHSRSVQQGTNYSDANLWLASTRARSVRPSREGTCSRPLIA